MYYAPRVIVFYSVFCSVSVPILRAARYRSVVRSGAVRLGWVGMGLLIVGLVWFGLVPFDLACFGLISFDLAWFGMVWYGTVRYGMVWYGLVRFGLGLSRPRTSLLSSDCASVGVCVILFCLYALCIFVSSSRVYLSSLPPFFD